MGQDKDDKKAAGIVEKHVKIGTIDPQDGRAKANLQSDIVEALLDARIEERMNVTGEDFDTAEGKVVAGLRPGDKK